MFKHALTHVFLLLGEASTVVLAAQDQEWVMAFHHKEDSGDRRLAMEHHLPADSAAA